MREQGRYAEINLEETVGAVKRMFRDVSFVQDAVEKSCKILRKACERAVDPENKVIDIWYANTQLGSNAFHVEEEEKKQVYTEAMRLLYENCNRINLNMHQEKYDGTRIIIAGSRDFDNYELLEKKCKKVPTLENPEIISGHARGADLLGERFAIEHGIPIKVFPANWNKYGRAAGPIRNEQMARYAAKAKKKFLVAFPIGASPGTRNMIEQAKVFNLTVYVVES